MDIEKTMRFMVEMQAKHESWLQKHEEAIARIEAAGEANDRRIAQLVDVSLSLARTVEQSSAGIKELSEAQAAGMNELREELREVQSSTTYKLNALIDTVDKMVRKNGHDGKKS
ncbi:MAG TPA: hypothetical protein VNM47_19620 [Terriglobia bacterium]|nr:hypothetical protein [Terriglobia bacterium]